MSDHVSEKNQFISCIWILTFNICVCGCVRKGLGERVEIVKLDRRLQEGTGGLRKGGGGQRSRGCES